MQLKKIEVQGFKSFASKTEIDFLGGITTIVGPNGSGKSNIADCVRWVLGEQSAKILRSSKMEDVIFAGTENRKKVGFAEVSIYIDNADGTLPVDFREVVVTRRIFRDGESNYLINNAECRLKDVQELFLDTGIGKDGYSIIGQGKIDEILSNKSEERRAIFEEAAGIMKYRTRKEEATRKLATAENNLSRVNDILIEIENMIGPLEEKSNKAKTYLNLREDLKVLDVNIFLNSLKENASNLADLDKKIELFKRDIALEEQDALNLEKAKLNLKTRLEEILLKIEESQKKYFEFENLGEKLNTKVSLASSNISNNKEQILRLENEIKENIEKISILNDEIKIKLEKKENLDKNKIKFETELLEKQTELNEILKTLDERGEYIESIKLSIENLNEIIHDNNLKISSNEATIEASTKQILSIEKNAISFVQEKDRLNFAREEITSVLNKNNNELRNIETNLNLTRSKLEEKNTQIGKIVTQQNNLKEEVMSLRSKYTYLTNLENENEGYFKSVKNVLDYVKENKIKDVYGTVSSVICVDEKYERAIEVALGNFLQNIIVEDEQIAKKLIEYLKSNLYGRATFLPLRNMKKTNNDDFQKSLEKFEGYIGSAISLCKYDKKFQNIIDLALNKCIVVDTLDNANEIYSKIKGNVRIVTLAGEVIANNGSITGGQTSTRTSGLLGREEKIKSLERKVKEKENRLSDLDETINNAMPEIDELKIKIQDMKMNQENINLEIATFKEKLESIKREIEKSNDNTEKYSLNKNALNEEIDRLTIENESIKKDSERIASEIAGKNLEIDEYTRLNKEKSKTMDFLNEDIVNLKISLSSFDESSMSIDEMKIKLEEDINNFKESNLKKENEKVLLSKEIEKFENDISIAGKERQGLENFKTEYTVISEKLKEDKLDVNKKLDTLEVEMLSSVNKIAKLREEVNKIVNRKIKFEIDIENLKNTMWDEYELTISSSKEFLNSRPVLDYDNVKIIKEAERIRKEIKALGDIDVSSIEEYRVQKERYDFITKQKSDLDETKAKLENLISNMTTIMKSEFSKQFKLINENFKKTFSELFGGGKANLSLTDESNILESGIEIEVQPPGKKLQSMMLLSGGERALTATALLFAILKIKAPPFCILDEIEAALDDVNVARFAEYIKRYSKDTQFIVITHRKGTMEVAKTVYGVTMEEYGVSKIISMKMRA